MRHLVIHICISGFTQDRGHYHGILKLREELIGAGHAEGPHRRVWYLPWTADMDAVAADLSIICIHHGLVPVVTVTGYSYGGHTALRLCRAMEQRSLDVRVLTLVDPVNRWRYWPPPLPALSSMLSRDLGCCHNVPTNVRLVNEFFQVQNRPQGHRLHVGRFTMRGIYKELKSIHSEMDDDPVVHACVLRHAHEIREELDLCEP